MLAVILSMFSSDFNMSTAKFVFIFKPAIQIHYYVPDPNRGLRPADGICYPYIKTIVINQDHWNTINFWQKSELVYHELGHCMLDLPHSYGVTIMNPFTSKIYHVNKDGSNWQQLVNDMRTTYESRLYGDKKRHDTGPKR